MSFLWHGLTEQGSQVPVQVDTQGRVIAVDATPQVSNWERTGTILSPAVPGDSVDIGSGNITLNANGISSFSGAGAQSIRLRPTLADTDSGYAIAIFKASGTDTSLAVSANGDATFAGNITAANVTFRSADPQFYVKKSKNKDALPDYVGPELDLLAEIARLEALVRHLYETLRITPPAGWPVWDGNDDVLRQLRK